MLINSEGRLVLGDDRITHLFRRLRRGFAWARVRLPFGIRTIAGLLLIIGGILGFLPILGFWMLPLGIVLVALDIPPLRKRVRGWLHRNSGKRRQWHGRTQIPHRKNNEGR